MCLEFFYIFLLNTLEDRLSLMATWARLCSLELGIVSTMLQLFTSQKRYSCCRMKLQDLKNAATSRKVLMCIHYHAVHSSSRPRQSMRVGFFFWGGLDHWVIGLGGRGSAIDFWCLASRWALELHLLDTRACPAKRSDDTASFSAVCLLATPAGCCQESTEQLSLRQCLRK